MAQVAAQPDTPGPVKIRPIRVSAFEKRDRTRKRLVEAMYAAGLSSAAYPMSLCRQSFNGFVAMGDCHCSKAVGRSCSIRLCPHCEKKRALRLRRGLLGLLDGWKRPRFVTLTIPNVPRLRRPAPETWKKKKQYTVYDELRGCLRRLRQRKGFRKYVAGGVYVLETTHAVGQKRCKKKGCGAWNERLQDDEGRWFVRCTSCGHEAHGWHPHVHIVYDGRYFPREELQALWVAAGGGENVYIQDCRPGLVNELAKYAVKCADVVSTPSLLRELYEAVQGQHLFESFGSARGQFLEAGRPVKTDFVCPHGHEFEYVGVVQVVDVFKVEDEWKLWPEVRARLLTRALSRMKEVA